MPIRIYTSAPARQLMEDRPFGIAAWTDGSHLGEVYAIVHMADGTPVLRGTRVSLAPTELEGNIEHAMRTHLGTLWAAMSDVDLPRFEDLLEEIPVEEFALTQIEKPSIRGVVAQISLEAQCDELANAFARFHETG
jgi:hypothetical protein